MPEVKEMLQAASVRLRQGDLTAASKLCRDALHRHGRDLRALEILEAVAEGWAQRGDYAQTAACFELMLTQTPGSAELHFNLGSALIRMGDRHRAIEAIRKATRCRPDWMEAWYHLALMSQEAGDSEQSASCWRRVLELKGDHGSAHFHLGVVLSRLGDRDGAENCFRLARQSPPTAVLCNDLGLKSLDDGQASAAIVDLTAATELDPTLAGAWMNLGLALMRDCRVTESLKCFETSIRLEPGRAEPHWNYAAALLSLGDYARGFREYEWRLRCPEFAALVRKVARQMWRGEDVRGRTVLIHDEQGFGDTIQFVRYVPLLADRGCKVVLLCKKPLLSLLSRVCGAAHVLSDGDPCPRVDFHAPIASMPFLFGTTLETIPRLTRYLSADAALADAWEKRLLPRDGRLRVGIVWLGNAKPNPDRTVPAEFLAPLTDVDNVAFYSLQKQIAAAHVRPPAGMPIVDFSTHISDFADIAALIANMDLVISIDTAAAHLSAVMGKPTWILLPYAADWRWLLDRDDSPWYPTARLFRQKQAGDWPGVIRRVAKDLAGRCAKRQ